MILVRFITNIFIVLFLLLICIDATPRLNLAHERLKNWLDPLYDKTGLWQGTWTLFASDPDKINIYLSAEFVYEDGSTSSWTSHRWRGLSAGERFALFKTAEYLDKIRSDDNSGGWPALADFLHRNYADKNRVLTRVNLFRHWVIIPSPEKIKSMQLPYEGRWKHKKFHTEDFQL